MIVFNKIRLWMIWNFKNFVLKFINGEWWQQKEANPQNNINETFLILIKSRWLSSSKNQQINWTLKID